MGGFIRRPVIFSVHVLLMFPAPDTDEASFKRLLQINPGRAINLSDNPKIYEKNVHYIGYQELNHMQSISTYVETHGIIMQLLAHF